MIGETGASIFTSDFYHTCDSLGAGLWCIWVGHRIREDYRFCSSYDPSYSLMSDYFCIRLNSFLKWHALFRFLTREVPYSFGTQIL